MSYLEQAQDPRRRATAIVVVAGIHTLMAMGLVAGLTVVGVAPPIDTWDPFSLTPEPKPTPPPPEPVEPTEATNDLVMVPKPPIDIVIDDPVELVVVDRIIERPLVVDPGPRVAPKFDPPALPAFTPRRARPANDPLRWLSTDDYPAGALRRGDEGTAAYRLMVGTDGLVSDCDVTRSTGSSQLDDATCRFILRRARFEAATDETGAKVVGNYTGTVKWQIPD